VQIREFPYDLILCNILSYQYNAVTSRHVIWSWGLTDFILESELELVWINPYPKDVINYIWHLHSLLTLGSTSFKHYGVRIIFTLTLNQWTKVTFELKMNFPKHIKLISEFRFDLQNVVPARYLLINLILTQRYRHVTGESLFVLLNADFRALVL